MPGHAAGDYGEEDRKAAPPDSRLYSAISLFNACVQQPRHIRAGPARPLRRPRLLPGRGLRAQMHPGRARVTWRTRVLQTGSLGFASRSPGNGPGRRSSASRIFSAGHPLSIEGFLRRREALRSSPCGPLVLKNSARANGSSWIVPE